MSGIFPESGVLCNQTANAACGIQTTGDECEALFYNLRCNVQVSPTQVNALISEIANAVNVTDPYDCSRLDNLKTTLAKIQNLCNQPTQPAVDFDDYLAGCFDGVSGKIDVSLLADLILAEVATLCELPLVTTLSDTDSLAGCIGGQDARVPFSVIRSFITPYYTREAQFYQTGTSTFGTMNVSGRTAFAIRVYNIVPDEAPLQVGSLSFGVTLAKGELYLVLKKGNGWYLIDNGVALFMNSGDAIVWQKGHIGNQAFQAYGALPF